MFTKDYARYYEVLNQHKQYKKEIEFLWNWAKKPTEVLDIGCGPAHYWKFWPKGVNVKGIERSPDMIDVSPYKENILLRDVTKDPFIDHKYELATALFDVIGYMGDNGWWSCLPLEKGGYFIFDIWDKAKVEKDRFKQTIRVIDGMIRVITPLSHTSTKVKLQIDLVGKEFHVKEIHEMFLYDTDDVEEFAGDDFEIADIKDTEKWQKWYKLKRK